MEISISEIDQYFHNGGAYALDGILFSSKYRNNWFYKQIKQVCRGKVCMDIGTGTGIQALFAIHAGAKHVFMIDQDLDCCTFAKNIFEQCNVPKEKYTIIHAKFNKDLVAQFPNIDVIISETIDANFFKHDFYKICQLIQNTETLKNAVMIPDKLYGSLMLYSNTEDFIKTDNLVYKKILTGVSDIDKKYEFHQNLRSNEIFTKDSIGKDSVVHRRDPDDVNALLHKFHPNWFDAFFKNAINSKYCIIKDAITFDAYNPFDELKWGIITNIPNGTYGIMIIGCVGCQKASNLRVIMNIDGWPTHFYKFIKTSDELMIHFDTNFYGFDFITK